MTLTKLQTIIVGRITKSLETNGLNEVFHALLEDLAATTPSTSAPSAPAPSPVAGKEDGANAKIAYLEDQLTRIQPAHEYAMAFCVSAARELGIDWKTSCPTYTEVFDKTLKVLRDCQEFDKTIFELRKERDELLKKVTVQEDQIEKQKARADVLTESNFQLFAKVNELEKEIAGPTGSLAPSEFTRPVGRSVAPEFSEPAPKPAAPAHKILPWTYDTSPEVIYEYVRLVVAGQPPMMAAQTAGVAHHERDKARVNFKTAIDGGKARTGLEREEFLAKQLKGWRERRDLLALQNGAKKVGC
jgi:hypothetical protein